VKIAAPVNMISSIMQGGSPCENAPLLRVGANNMEIGAMMAPRPMIMVSATGDWTRNTPQVEYPAVRAVYELYGKAENLETVQIDAPHNYNKASREAVYRFFGKHALGSTDDAAFAERGIRLEKLQDMLALHGQQMPVGALSFEGVFRQWKSIARKKFDETRDLDLLRQRLRVVIGAEWPEKVVEADGALGTGKGDRVPAIRVEGSGVPVVAVHPEGAEAAKRTWPAGRPGLAVDVFQTGSAVAPRDRSHRFFLTFNRSDDANRVQDILTAMRRLDAPEVELVCTGKAAVWCAFAAALAPVRVKLANGVGSFRGSDEDFKRDFFVPGIQRVGGLDAAMRVLKAR
jgi:hypothetical protein